MQAFQKRKLENEEPTFSEVTSSIAYGPGRRDITIDNKEFDSCLIYGSNWNMFENKGRITWSSIDYFWSGFGKIISHECSFYILREWDRYQKGNSFKRHELDLPRKIERIDNNYILIVGTAMEI